MNWPYDFFDSGIYKGQLLCSKIFKPQDVTEQLMGKQVKTFENWEICDSFSIGLFSKSKFAFTKILEWTEESLNLKKEQVMQLWLLTVWPTKKSENELFEQFFPIIKRTPNNERLYVKKADNWLLRNIDLNRKAIDVVSEILKFDSKFAKWIAKDAQKY